MDYENIYSQYIEDYKIRRNELIGLCPFHEEDTPSFNANLETGVYHCFGCVQKEMLLHLLQKWKELLQKKHGKK